MLKCKVCEKEYDRNDEKWKDMIELEQLHIRDYPILAKENDICPACTVAKARLLSEFSPECDEDASNVLEYYFFGKKDILEKE